MRPERGKSVLYLTQDEVVATGLTDDDVLGLVETALVEHGSKRTEMPAKIGLHPLQDTIMHAMPAWVPGAKACGIKWAECFPDNHKYGLPQTSGLIIMNDPETGYPMCIMDAVWVTAKRTPAVTALACRHLARKNSEQLSIIGCGVQGRMHLGPLLKQLPNVKQVRVYDIREEVACQYEADLAPKCPVPLTRVATPQEAIEGADVVMSATAILAEAKPFLKDEWVKPGIFAAPIDFDSAWEWKTMSRMDKFLVDSEPEMRYFMTVGYLPHGLPKLHAEIGEVVAGLKPGRESDAENIMDMNIGMGVEDVVVAQEVYRRACELGKGTVLPL